jgi:hypothetical protein
MSTEFNQNTISTGLGTTTLTAPQAGVYFVKGKLQLPTITGSGNAAGASQCVVTVNQNGSPKYVGNAGAEGFYTTLSCALADSITIVLTSAATPDQAQNAIKMEVSFGLGL